MHLFVLNPDHPFLIEMVFSKSFMIQILFLYKYISAEIMEIKKCQSELLY